MSDYLMEQKIVVPLLLTLRYWKKSEFKFKNSDFEILSYFFRLKYTSILGL